jgi:hypothetical protein
LQIFIKDRCGESVRMKEGEGEGEVVAVTLSSSSSSSRSYLSPVVRQDLAKLEKGGESRRIAMTMLKQFVEHLDPGSVPRFLAQVKEKKKIQSFSSTPF